MYLFRRKKIRQKVCSMRMAQKCSTLNNLLEPFGYSYSSSQDVLTSRIDAWQGEFGYSSFYDDAASHFGMIIDSLPIYFNYDGKTWLIELWKGQYGINTGCEIGIYRADRILCESELDNTLFKSVGVEEMPELSFILYNSESNTEIARMCEQHWWLTAFKPGLFNNPSKLSLWSCITLRSHSMAAAFFNALIREGYKSNEINFYRNTVSFTFEHPFACTCHNSFRIRAAQYLNKLLCRLFLFITRPFDFSADRLLYLYYHLPFIFRRILDIRKNIKHKKI